MKPTIPIAVPPGTRVLRLERHPHRIWQEHVGEGEGEYIVDNREDGYWQLWIHADQRLTQGTVLRLYDDGAIDNITIDEDGIERFNFRVKDADAQAYQH